jgi:hypothetical protein
MLDESFNCSQVYGGLTFSALNLYASCFDEYTATVLWTACENATLRASGGQTGRCPSSTTARPIQFISRPPLEYLRRWSTAEGEGENVTQWERWNTNGTWFREMPTPGLSKLSAVVSFHHQTV